MLDKKVLILLCTTIIARWSPHERPWPREHILKSLTLASKLKSLALASKATSPQKFPVLRSRTALFYDWLKTK